VISVVGLADQAVQRKLLRPISKLSALHPFVLDAVMLMVAAIGQCIQPDLEDLAAATASDTLQLVVAHTLHEYSLGVFFGPGLAHNFLLLLLLPWLLAVLLL